MFHEGSKGYLCCKRRVLEFDEFLKIEGCSEGNHLFVGPKKDEVSGPVHDVMALEFALAGRSLTIAETGGDRAMSVGSLSDAHAGARLGVCKGVSELRIVMRGQR